MDYERTIKALRTSLEESPKNIPLRLHLAQVFEEAGRFQEAADEYIKVLSIEGYNKEALLGAGKSLYEIKEYEAAEKHLKESGSEESKPYLERIDDSRVKIIEKHGKSQKDNPERIPVGADEKQGTAEFEKESPKITFKDVGGLSKLKKEIELKIILPYQKTQIFKAYGKKAGGGILLYGPPGCGKTMIARATAGEIKASFMSLEISDILDMWRGESERKLHQFFEQARRNSPTVIFIDEVDALGASRAKFVNSEMKVLVNTLLVEMDGMQGDNQDILTIGATNTPWQLDSALRRPGRFDKVIFVPPPDLEARAGIFGLNLKDKPCGEVDVKKLADMTRGFSGADVTQCVNQALENLIPRAMEENKVIPLTMEDLEFAVKETRPTTDEWFHTVKNYIEYANQSGIYDDVARYMKENRMLR